MPNTCHQRHACSRLQLAATGRELRSLSSKRFVDFEQVNLAQWKSVSRDQPLIAWRLVENFAERPSESKAFAEQEWHLLHGEARALEESSDGGHWAVSHDGGVDACASTQV